MEHSLGHFIFFGEAEGAHDAARGRRIDNQGEQDDPCREKHDLISNHCVDFFVEFDHEGEAEADCAPEPAVGQENHLANGEAVPGQPHARQEQNEADKPDQVQEHVQAE